MSKLLTIDATNLGHRAFHNPGNYPIAEMFGFSLNRWRKFCSPDFAVAVFDGPGDGWRHKLLSSYKSGRDEDPSKRPSADNWIAFKRECVNAGIRVAQLNATEADDLIASYVAECSREGLAVDIVTADKDLWQLVRDDVPIRVIEPGKGAIINSAAVLERWGVRPDQLGDLLALAGDSSDGYGGVPKIGPKTAARLLAEHGDLETLLASAALIKGATSKRLIEHASAARLCRKLAGLDKSLRLPVAIEDARCRAVKRPGSGWW